ncbi:hypothetical protein EDB81DRAFT_859905 [Dactylonectria macrodidyma]|uniref:Uncharacterized protein n=1 Tax=Dactylonectria macrodidyma TaxID=307937 RepID=A0A9P9E0X5_9HYPO|nr:hypothetical protein EDB81DRAFT_859905 [Dactylonectria macrodidyma]
MQGPTDPCWSLGEPTLVFTMTSTVGSVVVITAALTTMFTSPTECFRQPYTLDNDVWGPTMLAQSLSPDCTAAAWQTCYPELGYFSAACANLEATSFIGFSTFYLGATFSPGVCPEDQTVASFWVTTRSDGARITTATCCPSYACLTTFTNPTPIFLISRDPDTYTKLVTVGTTTISVDGTETTFASQPAFIVAWQESDLTKFTPESAPLLMLDSIPTGTKGPSDSKEPSGTQEVSSLPTGSSSSTTQGEHNSSCCRDYLMEKVT